jgi:hypothetical protein
LLSHRALLDEDIGDFALAEEMGVHFTGNARCTPDFFKVGPAISKGILDFEYVLYDQSSEVKPEPGTELLADVYLSYFNRTWEHFTSHVHSPVKEKSDSPAVTRKGNVIYLYGPFFGTYYKQGNTVYRKVVENCLDMLLPERLVTTTAPSTAEVTVTRQRKRYIAHVVGYHAQRRGGHVEVIEQAIPLSDVHVGLRLPAEPERAYLAPGGGVLNIIYQKGVAQVIVPHVKEHAMVVFED